MLRAFAYVGAAAVATLLSLPALAATATCNGGGGSGSVFIDITTSGGTPSCDSFGNGTVLNTASDPKLAKVVDTTQVAGPHLAGLTVNFAPPILLVPNTDGTFAFNTTGLTNFFIGFQLNDKNIFHQPGDLVNPDWFVFNLAGILTGSGTFDADLHIIGPLDLTSDSIDYVVLYADPSGGGNQNETPLPGALVLFGSVLGGGVGIRKWRGRQRNAQLAAA